MLKGDSKSHVAQDAAQEAQARLTHFLDIAPMLPDANYTTPSATVSVQ
jgi:hypothetical protein